MLQSGNLGVLLLELRLRPHIRYRQRRLYETDGELCQQHHHGRHDDDGPECSTADIGQGWLRTRSINRYWARRGHGRHCVIGSPLPGPGEQDPGQQDPGEQDPGVLRSGSR